MNLQIPNVINHVKDFELVDETLDAFSSFSKKIANILPPNDDLSNDMCSCAAVRFPIGNTYRNLCNYQQPEELRGGSKSGIQEQYVISVELHIDSPMIGNVLRSNNKGNPCGRSLVAKIRCLLEMEREVVVHHSYCKANQCVDALANLVSH